MIITFWNRLSDLQEHFEISCWNHKSDLVFYVEREEHFGKREVQMKVINNSGFAQLIELTASRFRVWFVSEPPNSVVMIFWSCCQLTVPSLRLAQSLLDNHQMSLLRPGCEYFYSRSLLSESPGWGWHGLLNARWILIHSSFSYDHIRCRFIYSILVSLLERNLWEKSYIISCSADNCQMMYIC